MNNSRRWILLLAGLSVVSLALLGFVLSTWPAAARSVKGDVFSFIPLLPKNWTPPEPPGGVIRISEVHYDPLGAEPGEEWIELFNPGPAAVDLSEFKIGDEETAGGGEGMYKFPAGTQIGLGEVLIIANQAASFQSLYGFAPDFELRESDPFVPTLIKYSNWAGGTVTLLNTSDEVLVLDEQDSLVDAVSWGNSVFAFSPPAPDVAAGHSLERIPAYRDTDTADDWLDQPTPTPGAVDLSTPTPLPTANPSETPSPTPTEQTGTPPPTDDPSPSPTLSVTPGEIVLLISEVLYDPTGDEPQGEWIELFNAGTVSLDLSLYKIGDEEEAGGGEGMYAFPEGSLLASGDTAVIANRADVFSAGFGFNPDFELVDSDPGVPELTRYDAWASGNISLGNSGDEVLLLDESDALADTVSWGSSNFAFDPPAPDVSEGHSLERVPAFNDTDTAADWQDQPNPDPGAVQLQFPANYLELGSRSYAVHKGLAARPTRTPRIYSTPTPRGTRPSQPVRTPRATWTPENTATQPPPLTPSPPSPTAVPPSATPEPTWTPTEMPATATPTELPGPSPTLEPTSTPPEPSATPGSGIGVLISEVFYDTPGADPDEEWIEIYNASDAVISLGGYKIGDEENAGGSEGMFQFPAGTSIEPGGRLVIALQSAGFAALYGFNPDFEIVDTDPGVPVMEKYEDWGSGSIAMSNSGDEVLLLGPGDEVVDAVTYEGGSVPGVTPHPGVSTGHSIERVPAGVDTDDCSIDFIDQELPSPGS